MAQGEPLDVQTFIDSYGPGARVAFPNGTDMSLGQALAAEQLFCPADAAARQDSSKRIGYLANMLAAGGSLRPEDQQYVSFPLAE